MSTELQFAPLKDELTHIVDEIIHKHLNDQQYSQKDAQAWCNLNLYVMELFSKKEMLLYILVLLVYGILILMVQ